MRHIKIENLHIIYTEKGESLKDIQQKFKKTPTFPKQEHTNHVCSLDRLDGSSCDGLITDKRFTPIGVKTADCIPLVLTDFSKVVVIHAGWRGLASNIVENSLKEFKKVEIAFVAPFIKDCCYQVKEDFLGKIPEDMKEFVEKREDSLYYSLEKALLKKLKPYVNEIITTSRCTKCDGNLFSYRNGDKIERMLTVAWLE